MPACQDRPCTPDRQICHCTGWPSQWHSDGLWDRRPGCRGAWIGCRHSSRSISSLLLCLHVSSSSHLWSAVERSDISSPARVCKPSGDHSQVLICHVGARTASKHPCFDVHWMWKCQKSWRMKTKDKHCLDFLWNKSKANPKSGAEKVTLPRFMKFTSPSE